MLNDLEETIQYLKSQEQNGQAETLRTFKEKYMKLKASHFAYMCAAERSITINILDKNQVAEIE